MSFGTPFDFVDASLLFDILVTSKNFANVKTSPNGTSALAEAPLPKHPMQQGSLLGADHEGCSWNLKDFAASKVDTGSF